jgi:hypothetical protein
VPCGDLLPAPSAAGRLALFALHGTIVAGKICLIFNGKLVGRLNVAARRARLIGGWHCHRDRRHFCPIWRDRKLED